MFARRMKLIVASVATLSLVITTLVAPVQAGWCCCARQANTLAKQSGTSAPVKHASCCQQATPRQRVAVAPALDGMHGQPCTCSVRHQKNPAKVTERILPPSPDQVTAWLAPVDTQQFSAPRDGRMTFGPTEALAAGPTLQSLYCVWRE